MEPQEKNIFNLFMQYGSTQEKSRLKRFYTSKKK